MNFTKMTRLMPRQARRPHETDTIDRSFELFSNLLVTMRLATVICSLTVTLMAKMTMLAAAENDPDYGNGELRRTGSVPRSMVHMDPTASPLNAKVCESYD